MNLSNKLELLKKENDKDDNGIMLNNDTSLADLAASMGTTDVSCDIDSMVYENIGNVAAGMRKPIHAILILDASGSMSGTESATEAGVKKLIKDQKLRNVRLTTVLFGTNSRKLHDDVLIKDAKPIKIIADGTTRLYDTAIEVITEFDTKYPNAAEKVFFLLETDGIDNRSEIESAARLKALVQNQLGKGREFFLLAEGIDAIDLATKIGVPENRAKNFSKDMDGMELVINAANDVINQLRINGEVSDNWSRDIDTHYMLTTSNNNLQVGINDDENLQLKKIK